jgi:type IV secretion system protein TrbL
MLISASSIVGKIAGVLFSPITSGAKSIAGGIISAIASGIAGGVTWLVKGIATFWISVPTPELASSGGGGGGGAAPTVAFIQQHLWWYMCAAAIAGVMIGGARMAYEKRGDAGKDVLRSLVVFIVTVGAGLAVVSIATEAADAFSTWIIADATSGTSFGANMTALFGLTELAGGGLTGSLMVIVFGLFIVLVSIVQLVLMIVRGGMLVILAGILPMSAAFTSTQIGRQWFRRCVSWLAAFVLYKPAAAIVYATAFRLAGSNAFGSGGAINVVTGLMLMVLAVLTLPALMKFVTPIVGATAAGSGAGMLAAGGEAAAAVFSGRLPTGAVQGLGHSAAGAGGGPAGALVASSAVHRGSEAAVNPAGASDSEGEGVS